LLIDNSAEDFTAGMCRVRAPGNQHRLPRRFPAMSDDEIPKPEPKEIDSQKWLEWKDLMDRAILRAHPLEEFGKTYRCDNCLFYLDPDDELSYCWHPNLRILVGSDWWCQWWEELPAEG
jgi:hypothetical protein